MLIEFEKLQENLVPKPRGGEGEDVHPDLPGRK